MPQSYNSTRAVNALGNFSGTLTPDTARWDTYVATMTGNITVANQAKPWIGQSITLILKQDATGSHALTWGSTYNVTWQPSPVEGSTSVVVLTFDGTSWQQEVLQPPIGGQGIALAPSGDATGVADTAALSALWAGGGVAIQLSVGTYYLTPGTLTNIPSNTRLQGAGMGLTTLTIPNSFNSTNDLIQIVNASTVTISSMTIDGNVSHQSSGTQYGVFISNSTNCVAERLMVQNWGGDGVQVYKSTACTLDSVFSTGNTYHGFEMERCASCMMTKCRGYSNTIHGLLTSPGEVGGTGSKGNQVIGCTFDANGQYGIASNAANADVSAWLDEGDAYIGCTVINNTQYGVNWYKQDKSSLIGCYVAFNGFFGFYGLSSSNNIIQGNFFHNNSQASNGAYDEILFEGHSSGHASINNSIQGNTILIDGAGNKARYAINQTDAADGPNNWSNNVIPNAGTAGGTGINNLGSGSTANTLTSPAGTLAVSGGTFMPSGMSGMDNGFGVLRVVSASGVDMQTVVQGVAAYHIYVNGTEFFTLDAAGSLALGHQAALATTATDGFPYIRSGAGAPTGVPTAKTGMAPLYYDTTNHKFWVYDGAWKGVTVA